MSAELSLECDAGEHSYNSPRFEEGDNVICQDCYDRVCKERDELKKQIEDLEERISDQDEIISDLQSKEVKKENE